MAVTRKATGSSRPRVFPAIPTTTTTTKKSRKPKAKTGTASTTGPKKLLGGTTTTKPKPAKKGKSSLGEKVKGVIEKVEGAVTGKPGKKAAGTAKIRGTEGRGGKKL